MVKKTIIIVTIILTDLEFLRNYLVQNPLPVESRRAGKTPAKLY